MRVKVEGVITSIEEEVRKNAQNEEKLMTNILLAQKGEKMQVSVRLPGHVAEQYSLFEVSEFEGQLMTWKTRDGVGSMVMVGE